MSKRRGRPAQSRAVTVTPVFRDEPDIEKLGLALIAVAKVIAEKKRKEGDSLSLGSSDDGSSTDDSVFTSGTPPSLALNNI